MYILRDLSLKRVLLFPDSCSLCEAARTTQTCDPNKTFWLSSGPLPSSVPGKTSLAEPTYAYANG